MTAPIHQPATPALPPLRFEIAVGLEPAAAFRLFTERIATWWPLPTHSLGGGRAFTCFVEPRVGGRLAEVRDDGEESVWGTVLAWEPPQRLAFTWHPGRPATTAQQVEVRFEPAAGGTRVVLEHRGWEALGAEAEATRRNYEGGWAFVIGERYRAAAERGGA